MILFGANDVVFAKIGKEIATVHQWLLDYEISYPRFKAGLKTCELYEDVKKLFFNLMHEADPKIEEKDIEILTKYDAANLSVRKYKEMVEKQTIPKYQIVYDIIVRRRPDSRSMFYETVHGITMDRVRQIQKHEKVEIIRKYKKRWVKSGCQM